MIDTQEVQDLLAGDGTMVGQDGSKIGKVGQIFLDDETSQPQWATVKTGMFGGAESFVPLADATVSGNEVRVAFDKAKIKDAPRVDDSEGHLSHDEESELFRYYGLDSHGHTMDLGHDHDATERNTQVGSPDLAQSSGQGRSNRDDKASVGRDTSGPNTDNAMTRSEERLNVGTEKVSAGKARLRKYVVTENVTQTVPVSHEEVRIEREPITDANRGDALSGGDITSEEHEVELSAEQVVVDKETVPVERVRMDTETVTEQQQVSEEVRKEQIDTDADTTDGNGKRARKGR